MNINLITYKISIKIINFVLFFFVFLNLILEINFKHINYHIFLFIFIFLLFFIYLNKIAKDTYYKINLYKIILFLAMVILSVVLKLIKSKAIFFLSFIYILIGMAIFILYYLNNFFQELEEKNNIKDYKNLVIIFSLILIVINLHKGLLYHYKYLTNARDMALFTNLIWQISYDGSQFSWIENFNDHRGVHWQPFLYILAFIYKFYSKPEILIFLQALGVYAGIIFFYLFARNLLNNSFQAFLLSLAFGFSPFVTRILQFDFHLAPFYVTFLFALFYFAEKGNKLLFLFFFILAASLREDILIYLIFILLFLYLRKNERIYLYLSIVTAIYSYFVINLLIPSYNHNNEGLLENFVMRNILNQQLFWDKITQLFIYFLSVLFIVTIPTKAFFLILLPSTLFMTLIHNQYSGYGIYLFAIYYSSMVTPCLFITLVYNIEQLKRLKEEKIFTLFIIIIFFFHYFLNFSYYGEINSIIKIIFFFIILSLPLVYKIEKDYSITKKFFIFLFVFVIFFIINFYYFYFGLYYKHNRIPERYVKDIKKAINLLPTNKNIPVVVNDNIMPHISNRKYLIEYELKDIIIKKAIFNGKFSEIYILALLRFKKYVKKDPVYSLNELIKYSYRVGYKFSIIYFNNEVILGKFYK